MTGKAKRLLLTLLALRRKVSSVDPRQFRDVLQRAGAIRPPHDVADGLDRTVDRLLRGVAFAVAVLDFHTFALWSVRIVAAMTFPAAKRVFPMLLALENFVFASVGICGFQNRKLKMSGVFRSLFFQETLQDFVRPVP